eukprot:6267961-Alexandrium_andersonii.AAC.1
MQRLPASVARPALHVQVRNRSLVRPVLQNRSGTMSRLKVRASERLDLLGLRNTAALEEGRGRKKRQRGTGGQK